MRSTIPAHVYEARIRLPGLRLLRPLLSLRLFRPHSHFFYATPSLG